MTSLAPPFEIRFACSMKMFPAFMVMGAMLLLAGCATSRSVVFTSPTEVEASCGECLFGLKGDGCDLAIRVNGRSYYVDGVQMDALGDAHAADGMCEVIRKARVTGEVEDGRFVASSFQMLPQGQEK